MFSSIKIAGKKVGAAKTKRKPMGAKIVDYSLVFHYLRSESPMKGAVVRAVAAESLQVSFTAILGNLMVSPLIVSRAPG